MLQHASAVQWLEHYQAPGEVKIDAQATDENLALLVEGNRVYNTDSGTVARICHIDLLQTEADELITARADITTELLSDRVVMATVQAGAAEPAMYAVYEDNRRGLPLAASSAEGYTERADTEITWGDVLSAEKKLAEGSGLGFKVQFDPQTGAEVFKVYRGVDRSDDRGPGYVGYFGTDVENLQNVTVTSGTTDYKNVAVVAGAGEGSAREVRIVSLGAVSGENRRELYVDARDLQREYQVATPTGDHDAQGNPVYTYEARTYTDEEYFALLDARGLEKLSEHLRTFSVTCDIVQNNIKYGKDYNLGDRMPIKLPEYGIYASARISSVTMIYEREGDKIVAILSDFKLKEGAR